MPIDKSTIKKGVFIIGGDCPVPLITKDHPPPVRYGAPTLAATAQALYALSGGLATAVLILLSRGLYGQLGGQPSWSWR